MISLPIALDSIIFGLQPFGGISNYWRHLIEYVNCSQGLEGVLVMPAKFTYSDFQHQWIQRMPMIREKIDARISRYLRSAIARESEVFHTSYYRQPARRTRKYVVSAYDFTYERYYKGLPRYIHSFQKFSSIRKADAVLCISESTRNDILEMCPDVDSRKLHVIYLGLDRKDFFPDLEDSPKCAAERMVLFVGKRVHYKRFDLAIEAIRQTSGLSLGIVGPTLADAERLSLMERLGDRWREFGPVSTRELRRLYSSSFAFLFPSDYEGFGLPILEAMACGCPVVAARRSSLPEVGGAAALYADIQEAEAYAAALRALESPTHRAETVRAGQARAERFTWEETFTQTAAIYRS